MIPLRISLKGFLCYKEEQEVLLDGSSLWMMAGLNGSGKSAVFDAMTFALFGYHRAGGQQITELINHDSDRLNIEFDFSLDGQSYRIRRTANRQPRGESARVTQQVLHLEAATDTWQAVENTNAKKAFNEWIKEHIGLNYETFTSSVLLLQGKAEKLIESDASGRFAVLAGIVDLERYRRLHEKADTKRKELKGKVEALQHQLEGLPTITEEQLAAVDGEILQGEQNIEVGQIEVARCFDLEQRAKQWAELQGRRRKLDDQWRQVQGTLADTSAIQRDLMRLRELNEILPLLKSACEKKSGLHNSVALAAKFMAEEKTLETKVADCEHRLTQTRNRLELLRKQSDQDETQHREVERTLRDAAALMDRVKLCEQQRETLKQQQTKLESFPADLDLKLMHLREDGERLADLERALPSLGRLHQGRFSLRQMRERELKLSAEEKQRLQQGEQLKQQQESLQKDLESATQLRQQADGKTVEGKTLLDQAKASLKEFQTLRGSQICRHCGQALTPGHFEEEKRRREREAEQAQVRYREAESVQKQAVAEESRFRKALEVNAKSLTVARDDYREWKRDLEETRKEVARLTTETTRTIADLPAYYRNRAVEPGNDGEPSFPTENDLELIRHQSATLANAQKQRNELEELSKRRHTLQAQLEQTRGVVQTLEADLPSDVGALRRKHKSLETQEITLANSLKASRSEQRVTDDEIRKYSAEQAELHRRRTDVKGQLKSEETQRKLLQDEVERLRQLLPSTWRTQLDTIGSSELFRLEGEKQTLVKSDVEGKAKRLEDARIALESLRLSREEIVGECDRFPVEARLPLVDAQQQLVSARIALTGCEKQLRESRSRRDFLDSQRKQREGVQQQLTTLEGEASQYVTLAKLLGREYLQRHLVRQAERQVVDHANAVLDRLSGGQLYLRLRGGDDGEGMADKALELEAYNRSTASAPINVAFLSGSQRFRVAVSLALGLGQYASRLHRPIESVIIDEGFGCLDRQGRQVMIQELQNLRGQLRCILLVSHQEEFADAFSDGYLFELEQGATRVKRFQR